MKDYLHCRGCTMYVHVTIHPTDHREIGLTNVVRKWCPFCNELTKMVDDTDKKPTSPFETETQGIANVIIGP